MRTFKDRLRRLEAAISAPSYSTASERADAMLRIIRSGRNAEERATLMEHLLGNFGLFVREVRGEVPKGVGVSDQLFGEVAARILPPLYALSQDLQKQRAPRRTLAERLLAFVQSLADEGEQAVALALLLKSPLMPYGEVPAELLVNPFHHDDDAQGRPAVLASEAVLVQLIRLNRMVEETATGIQRILALHKDPREVQALLCTLILELRQEADAPLVGIGMLGVPRELVDELLRSLPETLRTHLQARGKSCANENCPVHGEAVRREKAKEEKGRHN